MTDPTHRRACISCHGEGWLDAGLVDDWPTLAPCPECRPVTAALNDAGAYRADAPRIDDSDRLTAVADHARSNAHEPRTALWPLTQLAAEPPPGHRTSSPTPKTHTPERRNIP